MSKKRSEKVKTMFSLTFYLQSHAERKEAKMHHRQEKRDAKMGHIHTH